MNSAAFGSVNNACQLTTAGAYGPDRITYNTYDAAGELVKITTGYGTSVQRDEKTIVASGSVSTPFTPDGLPAAVKDGNGNVSTYTYDGFDRLAQLQYPVPNSVGSGSSSTSDYETFDYYPTGNVWHHRLRDGNTIAFTYDAMNRKWTKTPPEAANAVTYTYDNLGRLLTEATPGQTLSFSYDALGRRLTQSGPLGTVKSDWDVGGRRWKLTWPDGTFIQYTYDIDGEMQNVEENGATAGPGLLAVFAYDNFGKPFTLSRGNGVATDYRYDAVERLRLLDWSGSTNNQVFTLAYDPANGLVSQTTTNAAYAWVGPPASTTLYSPKGQNQYTSVGTDAYSYDFRGNLTTTTSGGPLFSYDSENRLTGLSGASPASLSYYPDGSLWQTVGGGTTTRFLYDGDTIIAEYNDQNVVQHRYVPGPNIDEPLVWYKGLDTSDRRWLLADHQGSVIGWADVSGTILPANINTYDEYGQGGSTNSGRFRYTGQAWLSEVSAYDYRARNYLPSIGRFLQTDPKGYDAGLNLYTYAEDDPVDHTDPTGLDSSDCFSNGNACAATTHEKERRHRHQRQPAMPYAQVASIVAANNKSQQRDHLIISVIYKESRFRSGAKAHGSTALGLMQMTKGAVKEVNRVDGTSYTHSEMADAATNVAAASAYIQIEIDRHDGDVAAGLNSYGTGDGYSDNIIQAAKDLDSNPRDPMGTLRRDIGPP